jgi:hypothetical protein
MTFPAESYIPKKTSRPMTVAEKLAFAVTWPIIAPFLLVLLAGVLVVAYPAILVMGSVPVED